MIDKLASLLAEVARGSVSVEQAVERLRHLPFEDVGFAQIDHHRVLRRGRSEIIFASHKTVEQVTTIAARLADATGGFLATRVTPEHAAALTERFPGAHWNPLARTVALEAERPAGGLEGRVAVVSAGTSDLPVAEEAVAVLHWAGAEVASVADVGVAGLHRLLAARERLDGADVLIVVAGMEGALPSVVAGLAHQPVIAVPTSVGYGASFGGLAALLAMLNSCADGVTVVNIDNGFGAAMAALRILDRRPGRP
ncbi:MAG: nickel pincer cofactor biosynthesis protein LarB [Gemmatimonadales bacterium]